MDDSYAALEANGAGGGATAAGAPSPKLSKTFMVALVASTLVASVLSTVFFFRELYILGSFPQFATQLNSAISIVLPLGLCAAAHFGPANVRVDTVLRWPVWRLACLGCLLSMYNIIQTVSIAELGPRYSNLVTILNQLCIPLSAAMSGCLLRRPITRVQLAGLVLVFAGVLVAFLPHAFSFPGSGNGTNSSSSSGPELAGGHRVSDAFWAVLFTASTVPQSFLSIWTEWLIASDNRRTLQTPEQEEEEEVIQKEEEEDGNEFGLFDVLCLIGVENLFAIPFNILFGLAFLPPEKLWEDYTGGWACLFGPEPCAGAAFAVAMFAPLGVLYMLVNYVLIQHGGAVLYFLVIAATVCVCNFVLSDVAIMGPGLAGTFYTSVAAGLVIVVAGLVVYADPAKVNEKCMQ